MELTFKLKGANNKKAGANYDIRWVATLVILFHLGFLNETTLLEYCRARPFLSRKNMTVKMTLLWFFYQGTLLSCLSISHTRDHFMSLDIVARSLEAECY